MLKFLKWLLILVIVAAIGLGIWGYAPDIEPSELQAQYGQPPSQFIELPNGQSVHVRDEGPRDAPAILLIHGSNASLHTWQGWVDDLKKDYRVVRYDQPGHGLTGAQVKGDYSTEAFRDTGAEVMNRLGINRYVVAGNSMGGWVAWNMALKYPARVTGLVLIDASGAPEAKPTKIPIGFKLAQSAAVRPILKVFTPRVIIKQSLEQSVGDPSIITPEMVDLYWKLLRHPGNREATVARGDFPRRPADAMEFAGLTMPSLILWGKKDTLIPLANAVWFARQLPNDTLVTYDDLAHLPMEEDPVRTVADLRAWLDKTGLNLPETAVTQSAASGAAAPAAPPAAQPGG
ncbi:alpha/beta hydrolase [Blastomonas sp. AAP53]|uniref:alpha/beta fold hydrolase n=1 Tax=Blastomonas sp. AAP53 TaxID=1248760 RepID=UPI0002D69C07|nr:alpha/beta hydrolase [Blastomonas sp. AAP53]